MHNVEHLFRAAARVLEQASRSFIWHHEMASKELGTKLTVQRVNPFLALTSLFYCCSYRLFLWKTLWELKLYIQYLSGEEYFSKYFGCKRVLVDPSDIPKTTLIIPDSNTMHAQRRRRSIGYRYRSHWKDLRKPSTISTMFVGVLNEFWG